MATLTPTIPVKDLQPAHGGGGGQTPVRGGGDSGGGGGDAFPSYGDRLRRARLGIILAASAIVMLFVAFTSALIVRRGLPTLDDRTQTYVQEWLPVNLPMQLLMINTVILLASSVTMELARRQIARQVALAPVRTIAGVSVGDERQFPWLALTVVLGLGFLTGQWLAWRELADSGFRLATSTSIAFVYLLTATHAAHLAGGVIALMYAVGTSFTRKPLEARRIVADVTAWYWHFMMILWLYIFALLVWAR